MLGLSISDLAQSRPAPLGAVAQDHGSSGPRMLDIHLCGRPSLSSRPSSFHDTSDALINAHIVKV